MPQTIISLLTKNATKPCKFPIKENNEKRMSESDSIFSELRYLRKRIKDYGSQSFDLTKENLNLYQRKCEPIVIPERIRLGSTFTKDNSGPGVASLIKKINSNTVAVEKETCFVNHVDAKDIFNTKSLHPYASEKIKSLCSFALNRTPSVDTITEISEQIRKHNDDDDASDERERDHYFVGELSMFHKLVSSPISVIPQSYTRIDMLRRSRKTRRSFFLSSIGNAVLCPLNKLASKSAVAMSRLDEDIVMKPGNNSFFKSSSSTFNPLEYLHSFEVDPYLTSSQLSDVDDIGWILIEKCCKLVGISEFSYCCEVDYMFRLACYFERIENPTYMCMFNGVEVLQLTKDTFNLDSSKDLPNWYQIMQCRPYMRSNEQLIELAVLLKRLSLFIFSEFTILSLMQLARTAQVETYSINDLLFKEGDLPSENDKIYLIISGSVGVYVNGSKIENMSEGSIVGDASFMAYRDQRSVYPATVKIQSNRAMFITWARSDLTSAIRFEAKRSLAEKIEFFTMQEIFVNNINFPFVITQWCAAFEECIFYKDEPIFKIGDISDLCYWLFSGDISVQIFTNDDIPVDVEVAVLHAGQMFGENGIVTNSPRTANLVCRSDVAIVYKISKADFLRLASEKLLSNIRDIIAKRQADNVKTLAKVSTSKNLLPPKSTISQSSPNQGLKNMLKPLEIIDESNVTPASSAQSNRKTFFNSGSTPRENLHLVSEASLDPLALSVLDSTVELQLQLKKKNSISVSVSSTPKHAPPSTRRFSVFGAAAQSAKSHLSANSHPETNNQSENIMPPINISIIETIPSPMTNSAKPRLGRRTSIVVDTPHYERRADSSLKQFSATTPVAESRPITPSLKPSSPAFPALNLSKRSSDGKNFLKGEKLLSSGNLSARRRTSSTYSFDSPGNSPSPSVLQSEVASSKNQVDDSLRASYENFDYDYVDPNVELADTQRVQHDENLIYTSRGNNRIPCRIQARGDNINSVFMFNGIFPPTTKSLQDALPAIRNVLVPSEMCSKPDSNQFSESPEVLINSIIPKRHEFYTNLSLDSGVDYKEIVGDLNLYLEMAARDYKKRTIVRKVYEGRTLSQASKNYNLKR